MLLCTWSWHNWPNRVAQCLVFALVDTHSPTKLKCSINISNFENRYEGEWHNNKKHGYGVTTLRDGTREEGKYKCNVLITSKKKKHLFLIRSAKFRERIEASVSSSQRASKYALQKADIAVSRAATARGKADMADNVADHAKVDSEVAVATAREFAPDFKPSVLDRFDRIRDRERFRPMQPDSVLPAPPIAPTPIKSALAHPPQHPQQHLMPPPSRNTYNNNPQSDGGGGGGGTPLKQTQFAVQPQLSQQQSSSTAAQLRRTSMVMNKQDSFDYAPQMNHKPAMSGPLNNQQQAMPNPNYVPPHQAQQPHMMAGADPYGAQSMYKPADPAMFSNEQFNAAQQRANNIYYSSLNNGGGPAVYNNGIDPNQMSAPQFGDPPQSQQNNAAAPAASSAQPANASIDHFDHYKRVPSRDSSMDRYARAASRMGAAGSRQPSMDRHGPGAGALNNATAQPMKEPTPEKRQRSDSAVRQSISGGLMGATATAGLGAFSGGIRGGTPTATGGNGKRASISSLRGGASASPSHAAVYSSPNQPFEDVLLRQRTLGQDIIPSPREPKRTESLYLPPKPLIGNGAVKGVGGGGGGKQLKVFSESDF